MLVAVMGGLVGIIAYAKYIKQNQVPDEDAATGLQKCYTINTMLMKSMTFLFVKSINGLSRFFRDSVETTLASVVFGLGKVTNEIGFQGKKLQSVLVLSFAFVLGMCAIVTYLFLAQ
jgi:NADH-quinone oxidoreductase subunit L